MTSRAKFIGEDLSDEKFKWLNDSAQYVQDNFEKHGHEFILIPCKDVDKLSLDDLSNGGVHIGTCITDCYDPVSFAVSVAGAISSFALTSKDKNKASVKLAETILQIVKEVAELGEKKNG